MIPKFALPLACLLPFTAAAEVLCALGSGATAYKASADQRPSPDASQLTAQANAAVKNVCGANCPTVVLFRNATTPNLMLITDAGRAKIVYAPQFLTTVYDSDGDAGIIGLLLHTLGHALDDALGAAWIQKSWTPELRADSWAGCALAKSSLSAGDMQAALGALAKYPSPSHPSWSLRVPAIRAGYAGCGGDGSKFGIK